ncbi:unnamed protein product [Haemonchus placei]|uniref:RNase H domain-containing protein n=1 Tax=Haemonchus placei TaxID=6290 RepID=A0A0N4W2N2_HAEPC|nr:unnamed protein product [Haemonchus placei]
MLIELVKNADGIGEYMIIELQGTIESCGRSLENETLGHLAWRIDNSEALLLIGHHLLEGKVSHLSNSMVFSYLTLLFAVTIWT